MFSDFTEAEYDRARINRAIGQALKESGIVTEEERRERYAFNPDAMDDAGGDEC